MFSGITYLYYKATPWHVSSQEALEKKGSTKQMFRGIHKLPMVQGGTVACVTSSQEAVIKSAGKKGERTRRHR